MASVEKLWASGNEGEDGAGPDDKVVGHIAHWRNSEGKSREKTFRMSKYGRGTWRLADKHGKAEEVDRDRGEDVSTRRMDMSELMWEDLDNRRADLRPTSIRSIECRIHRFETHPTYMRRQVRDAIAHTESFYRWRRRPKSDGGCGLSDLTASLDLGYLKHVFRVAAARPYRLINYVELQEVLDIKPPRLRAVRRVPLTWVQLRRLADAMPPHLRAPVLFSAGTGVRKSELHALRPQDFVWPWSLHVAGDDALRTGRQGWVYVDGQTDPRSRGRGERRDPKSAKGRRRIPIGPRVAQVAWDHLQNFPGWETDTGEVRIFAGPTFGETVAKVAKQVGADDPLWPTKRDGKAVTPHALRHHYMCALADELVPLPKAAEWFGDTVETAAEVYTHAMPDREDVDWSERRQGPDVEAIERFWERGEREWARSVGDVWGDHPADGP